jgi:hypothetical protein
MLTEAERSTLFHFVAKIAASRHASHNLLPTLLPVRKIVEALVLPCGYHLSHVIHFGYFHVENEFAVVLQRLFRPQAALIASTIAERTAAVVLLADVLTSDSGLYFNSEGAVRNNKVGHLVKAIGARIEASLQHNFGLLRARRLHF